MTLFSIIFLFTYCETDIPPATAEIPPIALEKDSIPLVLLDILIFKKEKKVELWEKEENKVATFVKNVSTNDINRLIIGAFEDNSGKMEVNLPGNFYASKKEAYRKALYHPAFDFSKRTLAIKDLISAKDQEMLKELASKYQLNQVLIFPNDARIDGTFELCINCPHWIVEIYTRLEMVLKSYPIPS